MVLLAMVTVAAGFIGRRLPAGFVPEEDQGYLSINVKLPPAASLQRTAAVANQIDAHLEGDVRAWPTTRWSSGTPPRTRHSIS